MRELVTKSFASQAMAFPDKVDQALAEITDVLGAKDLLDQASTMQAYATRLKAGIEIARPIAIGVLKIKAKLGELMPAEKGGRGKTSTGTSTGFRRETLAAYRKLAANTERLDEYYEAIEDVPSQSDFIRFCGADNMIASKHGNDIVDWYTPAKYIEACRAVMGGIDLDPASSEWAQKTVNAKEYYTAEDDGLMYEWEGRVFLNPPFKYPLVAHFVGKRCDSFEERLVSQAILLTNNNTDARWWQRATHLCDAVCCTAGRIRFYNRAGESSSPTNGQTFLYFGPDKKLFGKHFKGFGVIGQFDGEFAWDFLSQ